MWWGPGGRCLAARPVEQGVQRCPGRQQTWRGGTREEPGTLTQGAPVFPGSSLLGIEPKTPGWLVQGAVPGTPGGRRALVGSPLASALERGGSLRAGTWGAGRLGVFPRCGVGHAWTLGLVRRPVAISGLLRRLPSGARRSCCVGGGCSTTTAERLLTMRTLRVARS
jgi:hypothetical protein